MLNILLKVFFAMAPKRSKRKFQVQTSSSDMENEEREHNECPQHMDTESGKEDEPAVADNNEEALWDFLYNVQALDSNSQIVIEDYATYFNMFNPDFCLTDILKQCHEYIEEEHIDFFFKKKILRKYPSISLEIARRLHTPWGHIHHRGKAIPE